MLLHNPGENRPHINIPPNLTLIITFARIDTLSNVGKFLNENIAGYGGVAQVHQNLW